MCTLFIAYQINVFMAVKVLLHSYSATVQKLSKLFEMWVKNHQPEIWQLSTHATDTRTTSG
jgi:hypothetical protein